MRAMRMPWKKSKDLQLELLEESAVVPCDSPVIKPVARGHLSESTVASSDALNAQSRLDKSSIRDGRALLVPVSNLYEDPDNPRTVFPEVELEAHATDIRKRGILQPIVVHPADGVGRHRIHFGAMRLRAAVRAGLHEVPVIVRDMPSDSYAQVAENLKRQNLSPLELAQFIRRRVDAGESNAEVGRQLGMDLTTVAHHLALLSLPPVLDQALRSGRCESPRTLHELSLIDWPSLNEQYLTTHADEKGPLGEVRRTIHCWMTEIDSNPVKRCVLDIVLHKTELTEENAELLNRLHRSNTRVARQIYLLLNEAARKGDISLPISTEEASVTLQAALLGVVSSRAC